MVIDANVHPTPDGRWFSTTLDASVDALLHQMDRAGVEKAVVVGLPGYIPNEFVRDACRLHVDRLLPVASFNPAGCATGADAASRARSELLGAGFVGIKLHPRLNRYDPLDERMTCFLEEVASWEQPLPIWLCTFFYYPGGVLSRSPVELIHELVGRYARIPFILAHAGGPDLLRLAHAIRHCRNALLELSYTITKFAGSSVETDLKYLFRTFEQRLIFGSDFPEVSVPEAVSQFDALAAELSPLERACISSTNLLRHIGLPVSGT